MSTNPVSTPDPTPTPAPTPTPVPAAPVNPPATPAPVEPAKDETDWKAEARKWEARSKENSTAAARLAEIEEASKTEAQKQAEALAAAQAKVKDYEAKEQIAGWKAEVSKDTGVPATALAGSTKEEIEAHAKVLKELIAPVGPNNPAATAPPNGPTVPGQQPGSPATPALITQADLDALSAAGKHKEINELRRAGRLSHLGVAPPKQR